MSRFARNAISWTELGLVPDVAIRAGIRRLVQQRLEEIHARDAERAGLELKAFLVAMRTAEIAPLPKMANEQHYELPAAFFAEVLGTHRKYSSCYWPAHATDLDQAEAAALAVTCERADIENGMAVLDLGCGWGSLSLYIAERYPECRVTSISNSHSQREHIVAAAESRGIENIKVLTRDMNDFEAPGSYDRIVSVEMFEHMRNYEVMFARINRWLNPDGRFFMHIFCHRSCVYAFEDSEVKRERVWEFDYDGGLWTINGKTFDPTRIDAGIEQDSAEIWTFRNTGNSWHHPIHSHFTEFIVLEVNNRLHYQGQVQTGTFQASDSALAPAFDGLKALRDKFKTFKEALGLSETPYSNRRDPNKYPWKGEGEHSEFLEKMKATYGAKYPEAGAQIANAFEALLKLPEDVIDLILDLRFDEIRFDSFARYDTWTRFYPLFELGDIRIDRFMGGPRRDVALLLPNWEVKVFMRWKDFVGKHVMHCHNVVHEDHAMMIRWEILPKGEGFDTPHEQHNVSQIGEDVHPERIPHVETHPPRAVKAENDSDN